jgi:NDP-sugar pyrophosphorylase family protein
MSSLPPALVLAAGLGVRLQPLTSLRAKPAMPLGREPIIAHILRWLRQSGVTDAIVNLHHRPETITAVVGDGTAFGMRVRYSWESPLLGSGGGPRRAFSLVSGDELLIVNGDTLTDAELPALVEHHRRSDALVTMALIDNPHPERYGGVTVQDGCVTGFTRRGQGGLHFIGVQVARREAFAAAADGQPSESVREIYPALMRARGDAIAAWRTHASFSDVGTAWTYLRTALTIAGQAESGLVHPTARVSGSARVERSIVWNDVTIGDEAELIECVVADRVSIPARARYYRSVIVPAPGDDATGGALAVPMTGTDQESR